MIVSLGNVENNSGIGIGVFSREGRVINSRFNDFQSPLLSFDSNKSREEPGKQVFKIDFEESENDEILSKSPKDRLINK